MRDEFQTMRNELTNESVYKHHLKSCAPAHGEHHVWHVFKVINGDHILNIIYMQQTPWEEIMQQYLMVAMVQQVIERNIPQNTINFSWITPRWD